MSKRKTKQSMAPAMRKRLQKLYPKGEPGKASNYISFFDELVQKKKALPVVLFAKVSACAQNYKGNLQEQFSWLKEELKSYSNVFVIAKIKDVASGWKDERDGLKQAAIIAMKISFNPAAQ